MDRQCPVVGELVLIDFLILAVDDQPGWNNVPVAVKVQRQEGA